MFGAYIPAGYQASFSVKVDATCGASETPEDQLKDYLNSYLYFHCQSHGHVFATHETAFPPRLAKNPTATANGSDRLVPYNGTIFGTKYNLLKISDYENSSTHSQSGIATIPELGQNQCAKIVWYFKKCGEKETLAKVNDLIEYPSIATRASDITAAQDLSAIELSTTSSTNSPVSVRIAVSKSYGALPVQFTIKGTQDKFVQILKNGAPTDDGLQMSIPTDRITGPFYAETNETLATATNQGVGASKTPGARGVISGLSYMWGMRADIKDPVKTMVEHGNVDFIGWKALPTDKWTPLYTDITGKSNGYGGTSPLLGVRALRLFDSKLEELSITRLNQAPVLKVKFAHRYNRQ